MQCGTVFYINYFPLAEPQCECDSKYCGSVVYADNKVCRKNDAGAKYKCGSCQCSDHEGPLCQCQAGGVGGADEREKCKAVGESQECSGHGRCQCGTCQCDPGWLGKYCTCRKADIEDCGRGDHICSPGGQTQCQCQAGWALDGSGRCSCSLEERDQCRPGLGGGEGAGETEKYCSGRGTCTCNKCQCNQGFQGKYCQVETKVNAKERTCKSMAPCILKVIYGENETVSDHVQGWEKDCRANLGLRRNKLKCRVSLNMTGQVENTERTGLQENREREEDSKIPYTCSLEDMDQTHGYVECQIKLEFEDCNLGNFYLLHFPLLKA